MRNLIQTLGIVLFLLSCASAHGQSGSRPAVTPTAPTSRSPAAPVAKPKPQDANPFLPDADRDVKLPLALNGFCAVSLREDQQWLLGSERNQLIFDGQIYWFTNQRQRAMFAANPIRYVPALGGDCVVALEETGERHRGNVKFGTLHDERLFFFRSLDEQEEFRASPSRYKDIDLANDGNCLVSQLDQQKQLPGLPETTAIVGGIRYQFAGVAQQQKFLLNMRQYGVDPATMLSPNGSSDRLANTPPPLLAPGAMPNQDAGVKPIPRGTSKERVGQTSTPRAMASYCPVSIIDGGVWSLGGPEFRAEFDGQIYLFVGEKEQQKFVEQPHNYIPALGGHCVVTERDNDRRVPGNIYHAAQYEGQLYLFAGAPQKKAFKASPVTYANVDLVEEGNCIVTLIDAGVEEAGKPEFLLWHQGKRYLFASAEKRDIFQQDIPRYQDR